MCCDEGEDESPECAISCIVSTAFGLVMTVFLVWGFVMLCMYHWAVVSVVLAVGAQVFCMAFFTGWQFLVLTDPHYRYWFNYFYGMAIVTVSVAVWLLHRWTTEHYHHKHRGASTGDAIFIAVSVWSFCLCLYYCFYHLVSMRRQAEQPDRAATDV